MRVERRGVGWVMVLRGGGCWLRLTLVDAFAEDVTGLSC